MADKNPKVSIGLAVFNGEKYLEEAINSILAQTFTDFELILSDNASTDRTEEICRMYAAKDSRIRYHRNSTNIGGVNNENQTFTLSKGEYFRLAAHDDVLAPELLAKCVQVLDTDPSIVLCDSITVKIDKDGKSFGIIDESRATSDKPSDRFRGIANWEHCCEMSYGLVRADVMRNIELQLNYFDSDRTFLADLTLYGKFYRIPEPLFYKRFHPDMSIEAFTDPWERLIWFYPNMKTEGKLLFDNWGVFLDQWKTHFAHCFRAIARAPLSLSERLVCYLHVIQWLSIRFIRDLRRKLYLRKDVIILAQERFFTPLKRTFGFTKTTE